MKNILYVENNICIVVTFGIEGISKFDNHNKWNHEHGTPTDSNLWDLPQIFNECNGLYHKLRKAGHTGLFYYTDNDCWERDLRPKEIGLGLHGKAIAGIDDKVADNVELFFISTHGAMDGSKETTVLYYNIDKDDFLGLSGNWKLGDGKLKWLIMSSCGTINIKNVAPWHTIFHKLHEICGAYSLFYAFEDLGEDLGEELVDGHTVADAWLSSTQKHVFNPAVVIAAENEKTWNNGKPLWNLTTINNDHLSGHGHTVPDISKSDVFWISKYWVEKG
jgi:Family of unknown function (DUF6345)